MQGVVSDSRYMDLSCTVSRHSLYPGGFCRASEIRREQQLFSGGIKFHDEAGAARECRRRKGGHERMNNWELEVACSTDDPDIAVSIERHCAGTEITAGQETRIDECGTRSVEFGQA